MMEAGICDSNMTDQGMDGEKVLTDLTNSPVTKKQLMFALAIPWG